MWILFRLFLLNIEMFNYFNPKQVDGFSQALFDAIRMLGNTYNYSVDDAAKTLSEHSNRKFEFWIMLTTYGTFILAFLVITIALNNILIGISVNIAKEGIEEASFHRMNAMAHNLCWIDNSKEKIKN